MQELAEQSLSQLVRDDYRRAEIFESYKLDFCCGGQKTLKDACNEAGADLQQILHSFEQLPEFTGGLIDVNALEYDHLCDYIERKHHSYIAGNIPFLMAYIQKVYSVHGERHPELAEVLSLFGQASSELSSHMEKEESVLFPLIRKLVKTHREDPQQDKDSYFPKLSDPIRQMMFEHENVGGMLKRISLITHNYEPPANACNTYRVMLAKLDEFEKDLHIHVHLENNILFPGVVALEEI